MQKKKTKKRFDAAARSNAAHEQGARIRALHPHEVLAGGAQLVLEEPDQVQNFLTNRESLQLQLQLQLTCTVTVTVTETITETVMRLLLLLLLYPPGGRSLSFGTRP